MDKSMTNLKGKLEELSRQANALIENKGGDVWTAEEQSKFDNIADEMSRVKNQIQAIEKMREDDAEKFFNDAQPKKAEDTFTVVDAFNHYIRNGANMSPDMAVKVNNAMSKGKNTDGGYTVPTELATYVIDALKAYGGMRTAATVLSTSTGVTMNFPTSDGRSEVGEIVGENTAATELAVTFGLTALDVYKYSSKKLALSVELIQDSGIDIVNFIINRLSTRIARIQNQHFTNGTGTNQPKGIVKAIPAAQQVSGAVGFDTIVDLIGKVDPAYRGGAAFMMNDSTVRSLMKLKDTTNRPIWTPGMVQGAGDQLFGQRIIINTDMPDDSIIYGDLKSYRIRDVAGSAILRRFDDSAFALNGQVGFCEWIRSGGNLLDVNGVAMLVKPAG